MKFLLDTNVICEAVARNPHLKTMAWIASHEKKSTLSCITIGEIWKGIHRLPQGKRRDSTQLWVEGLENNFQSLILTLDSTVLKVWGKLYADCQGRGINLTIMDSLLAATALAHDLTLVTRNTRDFPPEVPTLNPWL